jgi:uracil-DNA glycosylase
VPPAMERLVLACLAKSAADRPQSAAELAAGLALFGGGPAIPERDRQGEPVVGPA